MSDEAVDIQNPEPEVVESLADLRPINLKYKKFSKGRKRKRYSKGAGDWQRMEQDLSKINRKVAEAIASGAATYDRERNKSARKKKDGAARDFGRNLAEALATTLDETTSIPKDVANMLDTKRSQRLLKRQLKMMSDPLQVLRD